MKSISFDELQLFRRVAALRNMSAAAREKGVPTSQVSRTLARVEKLCAVRLLHRSTHGLALTPEGETFLGYCDRMTEVFDDLEGEFASKVGVVSGLVRVAASSVVAEHVLLRSLAKLRDLYPGLRVTVMVSDQIVDMAREGIDISIRTSTSLPDTFIARKIGQLGRALYASPIYVARCGAPNHPSALSQHELITNSAATHLNRWPFTIDGEPVSYLAEGQWRSNDSGLATNMVLEGLGIGRLANIAAEPLVREGRLVPVLFEFLDDTQIPLYAVMASARQRLPKIRACIDFWSEQMSR